MRFYLAFNGAPLAGTKLHAFSLIVLSFLFAFSADLWAEQSGECSNAMAGYAILIQEKIISAVPPCLSADIGSSACKEVAGLIGLAAEGGFFDRYQLCYEAGLAYSPTELGADDYYAKLQRIAALRQLYLNKLIQRSQEVLKEVDDVKRKYGFDHKSAQPDE